MEDKVYSICIKGLQHLYQQITILDRRGEDTDDFVEIYEATYIILKSKINVNRKDINNIDIEDNEYLYYHSIKAVVLMLVFYREGLTIFGKKEMIPFRAILKIFFVLVLEHTKKTEEEIYKFFEDYKDNN